MCASHSTVAFTSRYSAQLVSVSILQSHRDTRVAWLLIAAQTSHVFWSTGWRDSCSCTLSIDLAHRYVSADAHGMPVYAVNDFYGSGKVMRGVIPCTYQQPTCFSATITFIDTSKTFSTSASAPRDKVKRWTTRRMNCPVGYRRRIGHADSCEMVKDSSRG